MLAFSYQNGRLKGKLTGLNICRKIWIYRVSSWFFKMV